MNGKKVSTILVWILVMVALSACELNGNLFNFSPSDRVEETEVKPYVFKLVITSFEYTDQLVTVKWEAKGLFPEGFALAWATDTPYPEIGKNESLIVPDKNQRSAAVDLEPGQSYYFRICQLVENQCAEYSEPIYVTYPASPPPEANVEAVDPNILLSGTWSGSDTTVNLVWTIETENTNEFESYKIIWSSQNNSPSYPENKSVVIANPAARSATLRGFDQEKNYFVRVCQFNGSMCIAYSNVITLTPGQTAPTAESDASLDITEINMEGDDQLVLKWQADSDFDGEFKILWGGSEESPTYPESEHKTISDPKQRQISISGFTPGITYNFRVCQFADGQCGAYSEVKAFTIPKVEATSKSSVQINLTNVREVAAGSVGIYWDAKGDFARGFKIVWSSQINQPVYPGSYYVNVSSPNARNAIITSLSPGYTYYFRVCKVFEDNTCGDYSNVYSIRLSAEEQASITLTEITHAGDGVARVKWNAAGYFSSGFKIVYSTSNQSPQYPGDTSKQCADAGCRSKDIDGLTPGKTYYFRVCRYLSSGVCDIYSNAVSYAVPAVTKTPTTAPTADGSTITLNAPTNGGGAAVNLTWSASGEFPQGFKVVWSKTNTNPTFPADSNTLLSNPAARAATIDGLTTGTTYYFRVCKLIDSGCTIYSNAVSFAVPAPTATTVPPTQTPVPTAVPKSISISSVVDNNNGSATVNWSVTGDFSASSFQVIYSSANSTPAYPGDSAVAQSGASRSATISGLTQGSTYYFRVCEYSGSACVLYSGSASVALAAP